MRRFKNEDGMTLIEIIMVVIVVGILSAIAIPSFLKWMPNIRLNQASQDFFLDMQEAKSLAIKSNTPIGVTVTTVACPGLPNSVPIPGGSYTIFTDDGAGGVTSGDGLQTGTEVTIKTTTMPSNVALCNGGAQMGSTSFLPTGSVVTPGTVTVTNDQGNTSSITLHISGNIRQN